MNKKAPSHDGIPASYRELWRRAMAQIGAGKNAQGAINGLSAALGNLEKQFHEAEHLYNLAAAANSAASTKNDHPQLITPRKRKLSQAERSDVIKTAAKGIAVEKGGPVNIRDVAELIASKGIDLDTPVPGTMIGNVLNKSPDWVRLDKGIFQHKALAK